MVDISANGSRISVSWTVIGLVLTYTVSLVSWATVEHSARVSLEHQYELLAQRVESIDVNGSRGYGLIVERQNNAVTRTNDMETRMTGMIGRMNSISDRISETNNRTTEIISRIDKMERQPR